MSILPKITVRMAHVRKTVGDQHGHLSTDLSATISAVVTTWRSQNVDWRDRSSIPSLIVAIGDQPDINMGVPPQHQAEEYSWLNEHLLGPLMALDAEMTAAD